MSDIVERLRGSKEDPRTYMHWQHEIMCEAADEIEHLRAEIEALKGNAEPVKGAYFDGAGVVLCKLGHEQGRRLYTYPRVIPDGWVMVPKEPTEAMRDAGRYCEAYPFSIDNAYCAMIAAAPKPNQE